MQHVIERTHEMTRLWWRCARMTEDTHSVVTMRVMGMSGIWSVPEDENDAMISEKVPAFAEAIMAGTLTAMSGRGADRVMQAVIEPISDKASANRARLAGRGPRLFGVDVVQSQST